MTVLIFAATDVARLITHANSSSAFFQISDSKPDTPMLCLCGDQGVYLMSNGVPGDWITDDTPKKRFVAYAKGMNPDTDPDWWETKSASYGGDDGVDELEIPQIAAVLARGDTQIALALSETTIRLIPLQPGDMCRTPSSLGGMFTVKILSITDGFAMVQNIGNAAGFDDAAPYRVPLDQIWRLDGLAARPARAQEAS